MCALNEARKEFIIMTDYILGKFDPRLVGEHEKKNTFRPESQQFYNVKHAPTYIFVKKTDPKTGETKKRKYDIIKCEFVDEVQNRQKDEER